MKSGIPQIVVGVIIILISVYITGWMVHEAPDTLRQPAPDFVGGVEYVDVVPENALLFNIGRYGSWALPVLGAAIIVAGTKQRHRVSARVIIICGVLTAVIGVIIAVWGFPTSFDVLQPGTAESIGKLIIDPGTEYVLLHFFSYFTIPLGLLALALGLIQHSHAGNNNVA